MHRLRCYYWPVQAQVKVDLAALAEEVCACRRCPRLVAWREEVARERRAAFASQAYWGRPLPGFGDPPPRRLLFASPPPAHGPTRPGAPSPANPPGASRLPPSRPNI